MERVRGRPGGKRRKPSAPASESSGLKPDKEGWITLFDGQNLDAWAKPAASKWKIVNGELTKEKRAGDLWTKDVFGDFVVDLEVKCAKNTNSGVFLRGPVQRLARTGNPGLAFLRPAEAGQT